MYAFTYERPATLDEASKQVANGSQALAGGQTMLAAMKQRLMQPEKLVDLSQIKALQGIKKDGNTLVIGAMCTHQTVENNADVKAHIPALADLAGGIGDRQVRAMGTIGGSVANNDPAACYPSAVLALDAIIHTNQRTIKAADFFQGMYATALNSGELITAIAFPLPKRAAYAKFKQAASRFALVGVFVAETGITLPVNALDRVVQVQDLPLRRRVPSNRRPAVEVETAVDSPASCDDGCARGHVRSPPDSPSASPCMRQCTP
jgi:carbon-monoxide dehydrogenase medium subunit